MTKRYTILQKKLQELESDLVEVFSLPQPESACHRLLSDGISQRFLFLNNLLSAEIASHPSKSRHLRHVSRRLAALESAFRDWDNYIASEVKNLDNASVCSCTESILNDDGEVMPELETPATEDPKGICEAVSEEIAAAKELAVGPLVDGRVNWIGKYGGVMASAAAVGAALMGFAMVSFSGCFRYIQLDGFLIPT